MKQRAFTLIELLVVIAIIGILSSIVLAYLKGTKGEALIARSLSFSHTINNALGDDLVGYWRFEEESGTAIDSSGYNNNCVISGAESVESVMKGKGNALYFDGGGDYVDCGSNKTLEITGPLTIEGWLYPTGGGTCSPPSCYPRIVDRSDSNWGSYPGYKVYLDVQNESWAVTCGGGNAFKRPDVGAPLNTWNYFACIYDGQKRIIYFNGKVWEWEDPSWTNPVAPSSPVNLRIGNAPLFSRPFQGKIDEIRIYSSALAIGEIEKHYAEGLERYKLAEK